MGTGITNKLASTKLLLCVSESKRAIKELEDVINKLGMDGVGMPLAKEFWSSRADSDAVDTAITDIGTVLDVFTPKIVTFIGVVQGHIAEINAV